MSKLLLTFIAVCFTTLLCGQITPPPGITCESAIPICNVNVLDGFIGQLPDSFYFPSMQPATGNICPANVAIGNGGGTPDNFYWFSFVAGSDSISITLSPFNCIDPPDDQNGLQGIQTGIFTDCTFQTGIRCSLGDGMVEDITLSSGDFVPGQTYYFYVDGYGGDICEFEITVNYAAQPFALPELPSFDQGNAADTVCLGQLNYELSLTNYPLDVELLWNITSTNPSFVPLGWKKEGDTKRINFQLAGTYFVQALATNRCDSTLIISKTIVVVPIQDEVFTPVDICANEFPYAGPQTEDPNGDLNLGWFGPIVNVPGNFTYIVNQSNGCKYTQNLEVRSLSLNPRQDVVIVACEVFDYHGILVFSDLSNVPVTISNGTASGCDSLVNLTVYLMDLQGNVGLGNCVNSQQYLQFNQSFQNIPPGSQLSYVWKLNNTVLIDDDTVASTIPISANGTITLDIIVTYLGKSCTFTIPSYTIDLSNLAPSAPVPNNWLLNICSNDLTQSYTVNGATNSDSYMWSLPPGAIINGVSNGNTVNITFSNNSNGQLCVKAINACGESTLICRTISITPQPQLQLSLPAQTCIDSIITIENTAPTISGASYLWSIGSNTLISGSLNSNNDIRVRMMGGQQTIQLACTSNGCSNSVTSTIQVNSNLNPPNINCQSTASEISFTWTDVACNATYNCYVNNILVANIDSNSFVIEDLNLGEKVDFKVVVVSSCPCSSVSAFASCTALPCNHVSLQASSNQYLICESDLATPIPLISQITGNFTNGQVTWSGKGISSSDFSPITAGFGQHTLYLTYSELGCVFQDSIVMNVVKSPTMAIQKFDPKCITELFGQINILPFQPKPPVKYYMDGLLIDSMEQVPIGSHMIRIVDGNNCFSEQLILINAPIIPTYETTVQSQFFDNQSGNFIVKIPTGENTIIDSVAWYLNGVLVCSGTDCFNFTLGNLEPGEYIHELVIYYDECQLREEFPLTIIESPKVLVPNVFSPNNDGNNDYWDIGSNTQILDCKVFDRWGNIIYQVNNFLPQSGNGWDGRFNNQAVDAGVYIYSLRYIDENNLIKAKVGDITIIK